MNALRCGKVQMFLMLFWFRLLTLNKRWDLHKLEMFEFVWVPVLSFHEVFVFDHFMEIIKQVSVWFCNLLMKPELTGDQVCSSCSSLSGCTKK